MNMSATIAEAPSGKGSGDENFPVGSFLLPAALRPHVAIYYAFARAIDDIADNSELAPEDKVGRLDGFDRALMGEIDDPAYIKAIRLRDSMAETGVPIQHGRDLVSAFKQDAVKLRYKDWDELVDYCNRSAAPVGRYLLDLHGESRDGWRYSDALCNALQVINHLQDCQDDYRNLDRVYLSTDWLTAEGSDVTALEAPAASPALRRVLDRTLDATEGLMRLARKLPGALKSRRLAMESAVIVRIADRLIDRLRGDDPIAGRVELTRAQFLLCGAQGVAQALLR
ncbi:MAG: squalene synthase HpnC [Alphaproteobacteria bacterium]|nr:squalene synthase HpnC [Alphaproteobacteria bacterium]